MEKHQPSNRWQNIDCTCLVYGFGIGTETPAANNRSLVCAQGLNPHTPIPYSLGLLSLLPLSFCLV